MFMNVRCPHCGHQSRVPERMMGHEMMCPGCVKPFPCRPGSVVPQEAPPPSPLTPASAPLVRVASRARLGEGSPDRVIHFRCPRCAASLESQPDAAGQKGNCPDCNQRLQIPHAPPPPVSPTNATMLAAEQPPVRAVRAKGPDRPAEAPSTNHPAPPQESRPARKDHCLECGRDVTDRPRVATCPDCGSLFCSASCYREHRYHAHPSSR